MFDIITHLGGSWFLSSLTLHSFPTLYDLVLGNPDAGLSGWILDADLFVPGGTAFADPPNPIQNIFGDLNQGFYDAIFFTVQEKSKSGL